jgi:hypothetical protein
MTTPDPHAPSEHILRKALANRTAGFVGVVGGAADAQSCIPIRLLFSDSALNCHVDVTSLDQPPLKHPNGVVNGEDGKLLPEHSMYLLPPAAPEVCPFAQGGHCTPYNYLNITLGNEEIGHLAFLPSLNKLQTLTPQRRSFPVISGKRQTDLQMELRLRGKPVRQHAGRPIYYVDLTLRNGTTLEKTLANARGTANRWFRSDRTAQGHPSRLRPQRLRSPQR